MILPLFSGRCLLSFFSVSFRSGRLGAPWRHIKQCTGNRGDHICFIDGETSLLQFKCHHPHLMRASGVVKSEDMKRYPPFGYLASVDPNSYMPSNYAKRPGGPLSASAGGPNPFRDHAKQGFKYWYEEKIPMAGVLCFLFVSSYFPFVLHVA